MSFWGVSTRLWFISWQCTFFLTIMRSNLTQQYLLSLPAWHPKKWWCRWRTCVWFLLWFYFTVILEKPIRIPRSLSVKASSVLKGFLNKVSWETYLSQNNSNWRKVLFTQSLVISHSWLVSALILFRNIFSNWFMVSVHPSSSACM